MSEFRTPYLGGRAWLNLGFRALDGQRVDLPLVVDTGSPIGLVLGADPFEELFICDVKSVVNNFGVLRGGWFEIYMPEIGLVERVRGYESRPLAMSLALDDPSFRGLVGLPVLRLGEYGGNAGEFWFRYPAP